MDNKSISRDEDANLKVTLDFEAYHLKLDDSKSILENFFLRDIFNWF